ncbi:hypothetical protein [Rubrobacter aplysinae]|uniref:hypothetical protein n=1 Tax=Rubrobacter aplysinae TaxID=909625 RepID=UPI00128C45CC|nr:hypothetical protein [Rubrobacter aplysinae]
MNPRTESRERNDSSRREGLPALSRIPRELVREERYCERCAADTEHIIYRVPKKMLVVYLKNHDNNVQATCRECARSTVLTGEERERALQGA